MGESTSKTKYRQCCPWSIAWVSQSACLCFSLCLSTQWLCPYRNVLGMCGCILPRYLSNCNQDPFTLWDKHSPAMQQNDADSTVKFMHHRQKKKKHNSTQTSFPSGLVLNSNMYVMSLKLWRLRVLIHPLSICHFTTLSCDKKKNDAE